MSMPTFVNRPDLHLTKALSTLATIVSDIGAKVADFGNYNRRFRRLWWPKWATIVAKIDCSRKCWQG